MNENSVEIRGEADYNKEWKCGCGCRETVTKFKCNNCETIWDYGPGTCCYGGYTTYEVCADCGRKIDE